MAKHVRHSLLLLALAALVALTLQAAADDKPTQKAPPGVRTALEAGGVEATKVSGEFLVPGTITYDNDTPFDRDPTLAGTVGNRFLPGISPHSITTVSFALGGNYGASALASVWDVNPTAMSAMLLLRTQIYGLANSPASTARFTAMLGPITGHSGSFIAGIRNSSYSMAPYQCGLDSGLASTCDGVALTEGNTATVFRGARVNWAGTGMFIPTVTQVNSVGQDFGDTNAIFRVTGENLPVELMGFSVD